MLRCAGGAALVRGGQGVGGGSVLNFFISHTQGGVADMTKFYEDLSGHLRVLAGVESGEVGFFDATSLEGGDEWPPELYEKLATCGTFIALYSDRYFLSEYCGREVRVFLDRLAAYEKANGRHARGALIPIKWAINLDGRHPALQDFQDEDLRCGDTDELATMTTVRAHQESYDAFVRNLARKIYTTVHNYPIPPAETGVDFRNIRSAFHEGAGIPGSTGPSSRGVTGRPAGRRKPTSRFVHFVVAAGRQEDMNDVDDRRDTNCYGAHCCDWAPYQPDDRDPLVRHVGRVVANKGNLATDFVCIDELIDRIEIAKRNNQMIIILVDLWAPSLNSHRRILRIYDNRNEPAPVMVIGNIQDGDTRQNQDILWAAMYRLFQRTRGGRYDKLYRTDCMTLEQFTTALGETIDLAQRRVLKRVGMGRSSSRSPRLPLLEGP
jgi:FxsC-like protein